MAKANQHSFLKYFSTWRIVIPIALGLSISGYLIGQSFDTSVFATLSLSSSTILWVFVALLCVVVRDVLNMIRIRHLTGNRFGYRKAFQVVMLWEFGTSVMPAFIGGSAIGFVVVHKEGIPFGKSTAIVMLTSLLDELYFVILVPIVYLYMRSADTFQAALGSLPFSQEWLFWAGYFFIVFLLMFIATAIFILPLRFKGLLMWLFRLPVLRHWNQKAEKTGNDLMQASHELRGKSFLFWLKAVLLTFGAWTIRFFIINALILAFMPAPDHMELYCRQMIMWVVMLVSPTPGASGVAEWMFADYLGIFIVAGMAPILALMWRLLTYYWYVVMGSLVLPVWVRRVFS